MKFLYFLLLGIFACDKGPPCPPYSNDDYKPGIYSKELGSVEIDGETCKIIETYERSHCEERGPWTQSYGPGCDGIRVECYNQVLTRITKCPSNTTINTITRSFDKSHREEVK